MRPVENWYFDLPAFRPELLSARHGRAGAPTREVRAIVTTDGASEFLAPPVVYIKNELPTRASAPCADKLPAHTRSTEPEEGKQQSFAVDLRQTCGGPRRGAARCSTAPACASAPASALRAVPHHRQHRLGRAGARSSTAPAGPHGVVLAREPVGAHQLHPWPPLTWTPRWAARAAPLTSWRDWWCSRGRPASTSSSGRTTSTSTAWRSRP